MEVQDIFFTLPESADAQGDKDLFTTAKEALTAKFTPHTNVPYQRIKFRAVCQKEKENMDKWMVRLRQQAQTCNFGDLLDENLRDQILDKVYSSELKRKMLELGPDMTLKGMLELARSWEDANWQINDLEEGVVESVNRIGLNRNSSSKARGTTMQGGDWKENAVCFRCGNRGHIRTDPECPARDATCHNCSKKGHYSKCCKAGKSQAYQSKKKEKVKAKVRKVTADHDSDDSDSSGDEESFRLASVRRLNSNDFIAIKIGGVDLKVIVDSGATCNVIDEGTWKRLKSQGIVFSQPKSSSKLLYPYGVKSPLDIIGKFRAELEVPGGKKEEALFYVIKEEGVPLLGRKTSMELGVLKIGLQVNQVVTSKVLGKLKDFQLNIPMKPNVRPVCQPLRRIPIPLRKKLDKKLKELEASDIIEKVEGPTKWSSQLVVVPKEDGDIRVCVDMRQANKAVASVKHHIPRFDDMLPELRHSKVFSKLDIESAFHQIELSPESREITTFLTHRGSYRYKRLLFGLNCASELFQLTMEQLLQGCDSEAHQVTASSLNNLMHEA
jgi:hypothetical protein